MSEKKITIRLETKDDYRNVENLTRAIGMTRLLCRSWTSSWSWTVS